MNSFQPTKRKVLFRVKLHFRFVTDYLQHMLVSFISLLFVFTVLQVMINSRLKSTKIGIFVTGDCS